MSVDRDWLERAVALAEDNAHSGQRPYGAVVVRDGVVLAEATNVSLRENDPTAHAELLAIRAACAQAQSLTLPGAVVYANGQPCPMCQAAALMAGVARVVYATPAAVAAAAGLTLPGLMEDLARPIDERRVVPIERLDLPEAERPFTVWSSRPTPAD